MTNKLYNETDKQESLKSTNATKTEYFTEHTKLSWYYSRTQKKKVVKYIKYIAYIDILFVY